MLTQLSSKSDFKILVLRFWVENINRILLLRKNKKYYLFFVDVFENHSSDDFTKSEEIVTGKENCYWIIGQTHSQSFIKF